MNLITSENNIVDVLNNLNEELTFLEKNGYTLIENRLSVSNIIVYKDDANRVQLYTENGKIIFANINIPVIINNLDDFLNNAGFTLVRFVDSYLSRDFCYESHFICERKNKNVKISIKPDFINKKTTIKFFPYLKACF